MKPLQFVRSWIDRHLAHEEALLLLVLLSGGLLLVMWLGGTLAPALTALVFAFILQGVVARLRSWGLGAQPAVWAAYGLFVTLVVVLLFFVLPLIGRQLYGCRVSSSGGAVRECRNFSAAPPARGACESSVAPMWEGRHHISATSSWSRSLAARPHGTGRPPATR